MIADETPPPRPAAGRRPGPGSGLLTLPEVAAHLGCSEKRVRHLVRDGRLRAVRLSATARLLFRECDVRRLIENSLT